METIDVMTVEKVLQLIFGVGLAVPGFTLLANVLINFGKQIGWKGGPIIPDGKAAVASNVLAVLFAAAVWVMSVYFPEINIPVLDEKIGNYADSMTTVFPTILIIWNWLAPKLYKTIRHIPVLGFSHSP